MKTGPKSLVFGTAGIPICLLKKERNTVNGIRKVKELGLGSMELEFVRQVNLTKEGALLAKEEALKQGIILTCHGQYFVNLNSLEPEKIKASIDRMIKAGEICEEAGVWSLCYHLAYYMSMEKERVFEIVRKNTKEVVRRFEDKGIKVWLRPETGGKLSQFGELNELIKLSQEVEGVLPCIDWAHHHARSNGKFNTLTEFRWILSEIEKGLGREALDNMHMHMEGIKYGEKGEIMHLEVEESDFNYKDCIKALKEFKVKGVVTCESPNIEEDALRFKKWYEKA